MTGAMVGGPTGTSCVGGHMCTHVLEVCIGRVHVIVDNEVEKTFSVFVSGAIAKFSHAQVQTILDFIW